MLDRSILDAARAELRVNGATKARRPTPWWQGWLPVTSAIAVAAVGLSVTWRVMDEQERHLREEMSATQAAGEIAGRAAPAESAVEAKPAPVAPAAMAPVLAAEAVKNSQRAEKDELRERRDASAAMEAVSAPARQAGKLEARSLGTGSETAADSFAGPSAKSVATPAIDAATPEAWLQRIRELRAAGSNAEAAQSLARFRLRYPDFALPDDLLKLK